MTKRVGDKPLKPELVVESGDDWVAVVGAGLPAVSLEPSDQEIS